MTRATARTDDRPRGVAVLFAGARWDDVKGTDRQIAEAMSGRMPVLWVDPVQSLTTAARGDGYRAGSVGGRVVEVAPGLRRLSVVGPPGVTRPFIRRIARGLLRAATERELRTSGQEAEIVVDMSLAGCSEWFPAARSALYLTDDLPAGSDYLGISHRHLAAAERRAILAADVVVCVSDLIAERVAAHGRPAHVIPNGCDAGIAERIPVQRLALPLPRGGVAGLAGNLNQRIDWEAVQAIADAGINLLLIGPVRDGVDRDRFAALCSRPNVHWTGRVDYSELPAYLGSVDVGITPYVDNAFNRASFPLKTLEYLAAGLDVVSSDLPAVRWLDTDLIRVATSPAEFVDAVRAALSQAAAGDVVARRRAFAASHGWDRRVDDLLGAIGGGLAAATQRPAPRADPGGTGLSYSREPTG